MAAGSQSQASGGVGFFELLAVLFIGLKLTGYISWSWWWVTAPLWGPVAAIIIVHLIILGAGAIFARRAVRKL